jgi:protein phosphatase 4 regulatory subunit 3
MKFFLEFSNIIKLSISNLKSNIYDKLIENGLFKVIEKTLISKYKKVRHCSSEIIFALINFEKNLFKRYIVEEFKKNNKCDLFKNFLTRISNEKEFAIQENVFESLQELLKVDTQTIDEQFISIFYLNFISYIIEPLNIDEPKKPNFENKNLKEIDKENKNGNIINQKENINNLKLYLKKNKIYDSELRLNLQSKIHCVDIISNCVSQNSFKSRNYILKNNIIFKIKDCLKNTNKKDLMISIIKFVRSCANLRDVLFDNQIIKSEIFDIIMLIFKANSKKNNLINSAIIELFDFIATAKREKFINYLVGKYKSDFEEIKYVETFALLIKLNGKKSLNISFSSEEELDDKSDEEEYFDKEEEKKDEKKKKDFEIDKEEEKKNENKIDEEKKIENDVKKKDESIENSKIINKINHLCYVIYTSG